MPAAGVTESGTEDEFPTLRRPVLVAAFEGWNDAGDAASGAVEHLELTWDAQPLAELDSEDYYDYQVNRPTVRQVKGVTREIVWPTTRLSVCSPPAATRDIVLLRGIEPNMRWRRFCADVIELIEQLEIETVVILGALLADTPHTRPVPVTGSAYSSEAAEQFHLEQSRYEGPTGITGVLQDELVRAGIPSISFWAAVPHYIAQPPNPKATMALLQRVEDVLDLEVPLGELPAQSEDWEEAVTEMTSEDEDIGDYVRSLEERGDAEADISDVIAKIDGDAIAAEFEKYLRRRGPGSFGA
ncbi:PAC2 family protein [Rhodococcus triatomae]|uniref:Predicted ATP-dependent carboligase, ATP-grasp superfamily n=1 Tax=Rhodococcus triatomae TaxID=300028 RepID=A0A1G8P6W0_9NOCA|nr:PAC2 family protein [Rhodococcus triatomae]QNG25948.1 PAC2 family protein [Rhodococcus triatomae]SDI88028.1 Predicted ATP-dependent carboligase, ATP-grasp superfamily [Rhodococcus triatomae]